MIDKLLSVAVLFTLGFTTYVNIGQSERIAALEDRIAAVELAPKAETLALIKFYTVPGYDCDTSEIAGHCTKWNITQAAYDKDFFKEEL